MLWIRSLHDLTLAMDWSTVVAHSVRQSGRRSGYLLLCLLLLMMCSACASKEARVPETAPTVPLPEVRQITFRGNTQFSSRELRKEMVTQQRPLLPPWKRGESYNPPTLQADLQRVKKFYFDRGFLDTSVRLENVQEEEEKRTVRLEIVIEEGAPTPVTEVHLTGTVPPELPPAQKLLEALSLRPGAQINKAAFDQSKALLLKLLQDAGYARAQVIPETEVDTEAHTATVTFTLASGTRTTFGHVTIKGAQQVKEQTIRRKLTFREGQIYSDKELTTSADAIYELGMFQAVTPHPLNFEEADAPLDVEMEVRERKPHFVQVGFGYSTVERFRLQAEWTHRNLFGGAQRLTLAGKMSSFEQTFETRLRLPYFLERRTIFTQTLFVYNQHEINTDPTGLSDALFKIEDPHPNFDLFRVGGESRIGHQFTRTLSGFTGLELSLNNFYNVNTSALTPAEREAAKDYLLFLQFVEMRWDTSDNPLNPTRGLLLRGKVEHANSALLSDVSFAKLTLEVRHYRRLWWKVILATRLEIGGIQPYGDTTEVPFNVRFFAGGPGSVRGFAVNRLGPLDAEGEPLGGNSLLEGSLELRFPLFGVFGGALFVDFGNVFSDAFTYRLSELRYAVGPGVRYNTPIGPLRLDIGFIVDRRPDETWGRVELSIGQAF
jgi:outer membrane protein insertion porin family